MPPLIYYTSAGKSSWLLTSTIIVLFLGSLLQLLQQLELGRRRPGTLDFALFLHDVRSVRGMRMLLRWLICYHVISASFIHHPFSAPDSRGIYVLSTWRLRLCLICDDSRYRSGRRIDRGVVFEVFKLIILFNAYDHQNECFGDLLSAFH